MNHIHHNLELYIKQIPYLLHEQHHPREVPTRRHRFPSCRFPSKLAVWLYIHPPQSPTQMGFLQSKHRKLFCHCNN